MFLTSVLLLKLLVAAVVFALPVVAAVVCYKDSKEEKAAQARYAAIVKGEAIRY